MGMPRASFMGYNGGIGARAEDLAPPFSFLRVSPGDRLKRFPGPQGAEQP